MWDLRGRCQKPRQLGLEIGAEHKTTQHTEMKYNDKKITRVAKTANVHMTQKPLSFGNQGLITQDRKVHEPVVKQSKGRRTTSPVSTDS